MTKRNNLCCFLVMFGLTIGSSFAATSPNAVPSTWIVQAADTSAPAQAKKPKKQKKAKAKPGGGPVTFYEGSAESRSERDKRLSRECRGRPNAGACEGYARP